ncbi:unnamed protein product [Boreogadus saida]
MWSGNSSDWRGLRVRVQLLSFFFSYFLLSVMPSPRKTRRPGDPRVEDQEARRPGRQWVEDPELCKTGHKDERLGGRVLRERSTPP